MNEVNFYKDLLPLQLPVAEVLHNHHFFPVPPTWQVIVADVKNSTAAVKDGRHNDVNLVAAGSLIAALNISKARKIDIPYFFGGDGGSVLVPQKLLKEVLAGLAHHNQNSRKYFGLEMHIGYLSMEEILQAGHSIRIAKQRIDPYFIKPIIIGDGMRYAEQQIKQILSFSDLSKEIPGRLNLTGLECRWDRVKPPVEEHYIVCYLIEVLQPENQLDTFRNVLQQIENIFGDVAQRNPLSVERLRLLLSFNKLKKEMLAKYGKWKTAYFIGSFIRNLFGRLSFKYKLKTVDFDAQEYLEELVAHSDTLMIDGRINTIISGSPEQHNKLIQFLKQQEDAGRLMFGHHENKESVITCYIEERKAKHIHFVDGAEGGYTEAAKELKRKLLTSKQPGFINNELNTH